MNQLLGNRLFLDGHIWPVPGYVGSDHSIYLPLPANGENTSTGIRATPETVAGPAVARELSAYAQTRPDIFPNRENRFRIYPNLESFEQAVRPQWMMDLFWLLDRDIDLYDEQVKNSKEKIWWDTFKEGWQRLAGYRHALLYSGLSREARGTLTVNPTRLALVGDPCTQSDPSTHLRLDLLYQVFQPLEMLYGFMLRPRIFVRTPQGRSHELHDPFSHSSGICFSEDLYLQGADRPILQKTVLRANQRSTEIYSLNEEGNLASFESEDRPDSDFELMRENRLSSQMLFLGQYLFARYRIDAEDAKTLLACVTLPHDPNATIPGSEFNRYADIGGIVRALVTRKGVPLSEAQEVVSPLLYQLLWLKRYIG